MTLWQEILRLLGFKRETNLLLQEYAEIEKLEGKIKSLARITSSNQISEIKKWAELISKEKDLTDVRMESFSKIIRAINNLTSWTKKTNKESKELKKNLNTILTTCSKLEKIAKKSDLKTKKNIRLKVISKEIEKLNQNNQNSDLKENFDQVQLLTKHFQDSISKLRSDIKALSEKINDKIKGLNFPDINVLNAKIKKIETETAKFAQNNKSKEIAKEIIDNIAEDIESVLDAGETLNNTKEQLNGFLISVANPDLKKIKEESSRLLEEWRLIETKFLEIIKSIKNLSVRNYQKGQRTKAVISRRRENSFKKAIDNIVEDTDKTINKVKSEYIQTHSSPDRDRISKFFTKSFLWANAKKFDNKENLPLLKHEKELKKLIEDLKILKFMLHNDKRSSEGGLLYVATRKETEDKVSSETVTKVNNLIAIVDKDIRNLSEKEINIKKLCEIILSKAVSTNSERKTLPLKESISRLNKLNSVEIRQLKSGRVLIEKGYRGNFLPDKITQYMIALSKLAIHSTEAILPLISSSLKRKKKEILKLVKEVTSA